VFSALKRWKADQLDTQEWTFRVTRDLLKRLSTGVVRGSDVDLDWLRLKIDELDSKVEPDSPPETLLEVLDQAGAQLAEYNVATARHFHRQLTELDSLIELLTKTLRWAREENEARASRLSALQQRLERLAGTADSPVLKSALAECAGLFQEERTRHKRQSEQAVGELQEEFNKIEARRQREAGAAGPLKMSGKAGPARPPATPDPAPMPAPEADQGAAAASAKPPPPPAPAAPPPDASDDEDAITGLPGRLHAEQALARALIEKRPAFAVAVCFDRLAMTEKRYGEQLRDDLLVHFGMEYAQALGPDDRLFRWGRSSFLALLERTGSKEWIQMEIDRKFSVRFKKTVVANGRSVLLNMGANWKMWPLLEVNSFADLIREITAYIRDS
jgi:GGDEF domain-containing protein